MYIFVSVLLPSRRKEVFLDCPAILRVHRVHVEIRQGLSVSGLPVVLSTGLQLTLTDGCGPLRWWVVDVWWARVRVCVMYGKHNPVVS